MIQALQQALHSFGAHADLSSQLMVFFLGLTRIGMAISRAPFFGGEGLVSPVKVGLSAMFTALLLPSAGQDVPPAGVSSLLFIGLLAKEALLGLCIGFVTQLIFFAVQTAGALVDTARGMDQPGLFAPQLQSNASSLAQFKLQAALVLFLTMNGHLIFIRALARSFQQLPVLGFPKMAAGATALAEQFAHISAEVFLVALQLSAPMLIALFVVDACFGVLSKAAPQVNVYIESMPVKSMVGLVVFLLAAGFIFARLEGHFSRFFWHLYTVMDRLG